MSLLFFAFFKCRVDFLKAVKLHYETVKPKAKTFTSKDDYSSMLQEKILTRIYGAVVQCYWKHLKQDNVCLFFAFLLYFVQLHIAIGKLLWTDYIIYRNNQDKTVID